MYAVVQELLDVRVLDVLVHEAEEGAGFELTNVRDCRVVSYL